MLGVLNAEPPTTRFQVVHQTRRPGYASRYPTQSNTLNSNPYDPPPSGSTDSPANFTGPPQTDFRNGSFGCAISTLFVAFITLCLAMSVAYWERLLPVFVTNAMPHLVWIAALVLGGYAASWKAAFAGAHTRKWSSALTVGMLTEVLILLIHFHQRTMNSRGMFDLSTTWHAIAYALVTIPAALLGGLIWEKTCPVDLRHGASRMSE
ncbi:hypothetical protein SH528x_003579 [Novipirellula sp. SH528]|uniref:hypothetical protein n=1 Tax=Novipirellula sp. SH528 TaxID=3454466 RepID=UPI003F9EE3E4